MGEWLFNGNAADTSGQGNNGQVNGAVLTTDRFGNPNSAYSFNGSNAYIQLPNSNSLQIGLKDYTIAAWIKTDTQSNVRIYSKGDTNCSTGMVLRTAGGFGSFSTGSLIVHENAYAGTCKLFVRSDGNGGGTVPLTNDNQWHLVVVSVTRKTGAALFVDGNPVSFADSDTSTLDLSNSASPRIGMNDGSLSEQFKGAIDDVRIWARALTADEVQVVNTEGHQPTDYFVSPTGNDATGNGSINMPWKTIQKCAAAALYGDTCQIRAGLYRETVRPAHLGIAGSPITFTPYNGEDVTISGTELLPGPWVQYSGHIYQTAMPWSIYQRTPAAAASDQIFVDGKMMPEARWPNITPDRVTHTSTKPGATDLATADTGKALDNYSGVYTASALTQLPSSLFNGGKITFHAGVGDVSTTCDVTSQATNAVSFQCNPDPAASGGRADLFSPWDNGMPNVPKSGNSFYLFGKLATLDAPGEWFVDRANQLLYLWMPDGTVPQPSRVEARRRLWAFDITDRANIVIKDLRLFGASIRMNRQESSLGLPYAGTRNVVIDEIEALYPWHVMEILPFSDPPYLSSAFDVRGSNITIQNSHLTYSAADMFTVSGDSTNNSIQNNVIHDCGYSGGYSEGDCLFQSPERTPSLVSTPTDVILHNTIFLAGKHATANDVGGKLMYNDVYQANLQNNGIDGGLSTNFDGQGTIMAYNLVHDSGGKSTGILIDIDSYNWSIFNNVIWNVYGGLWRTDNTGTGAVAKPIVGPATVAFENIKFYQNTIDGDIVTASSDTSGTEAGTTFSNNIATAINIWGRGTPALANNYVFSDRSMFVDAANHDYRLRPNSPAVDYGQIIPGFTTAYSGNAPDAGAFEGEQDWVAGALIRPKDMAGLQVSCNLAANNLYTTCNVSGLPLGRKLPLDFRIVAGNTTGKAGSQCRTVMDYSTNSGTGFCQVPTNALTGGVSLSISLGPTAAWQAMGTVNLGSGPGFAASAVSPNIGSGGMTLSISGTNFDVVTPPYRIPITIHNPSSTTFDRYQIPIVLDTARLIASGKMRADCGDIRSLGPMGNLDYWLESGCNTAATRIWVSATFLPPGDSLIAISYGNPAQSSISDGRKTFYFFEDFSGTLDPAFRLPAPTPGVSVGVVDGQMRISGTGNSFTGIHIYFAPGALPDGYAIDSELSVLSGTSQYQAYPGLSPFTLFSRVNDTPTPKRIGYYDTVWHDLGLSTVGGIPFSGKRFSMGVIGPSSSRTAYWFEDGDLLNPRAIRGGLDTNVVYVGPTFAYSDTGTATAPYDARFDSIRIRQFTYPEPTATLGIEQAGATVTVGGVPCPVLSASSTQITCQVPFLNTPNATFDVTVTNPSGMSYTLANAFTYTTAATITAVANGASFQAGFGSATWVSIFGANLAQTTRTWQGSDFVNGLLPTSLNGVSVTINGRAASVGFVSLTQINVLAPDDAAMGAVQVQVTMAQGKSNSFTALKQQFAPGFFTMGGSYAAALHADYTYVAKPGLLAGVTTQPAKPGETILIYGTGFGPTNPQLPSAQLVTTPAVLANSVQVTIGGVSAPVAYAGLVGAGLYQLNVTVPNVPSGDAAVVAQIGGVQTQTGVSITIQ